MRQTMIGGALPEEMATRVRNDELSFSLDLKMEKDLFERLRLLPPGEMLTYLGTNGRDKRLLVRYDESDDDTGVLRLTTRQATATAAKVRAVDRLNDVVKACTGILPDVKERADRATHMLLAESCPNCKVTGIIHNFLKVVAKGIRELPDKTGVLVKLAEEMNASDARYLEAIVNSTMLAAPFAVTTEVRNPNVAIPPSVGGPRPSCPDCCRKHLGKAVAQLAETELGYPNHFWLAMGNLSEMEEESLRDYPGFALLIREVRLEMTENREYKPDMMQFFDMIDELQLGSEENVEKR